MTFVAPAGYVISTPNIGADDTVDSDADRLTGVTTTFTLAPGQNDLTWDAGMFRLASLGDRVWEDLNANGIQEAGEPGLDGVTVNLLGAGPDGLFSTGDDVTSSVITSGGGLYQFNSLTPGLYRVTFVPPAGYTIAKQDLGGNDALDSDANQLTGQTATITLTSNQTDVTWDAGMYRPATLGNFVWDDLNGNGIQDAGEPGIDGVTVNVLGAGPDGLFATLDDVTGTTTTAGGGLIPVRGS